MERANAIILIDANRYLELYRVIEGRKLLGTLNEQKQYIFVTTQLANEVQRNKVEIAATFFSEQLKKLKLESVGVPDHLFGMDAKAVKEFRGKISGLGKTFSELKADIFKKAHDALAQISCSEDEVSKALDVLFKGAVQPDEKTLDKAATRKDLGRPPGKPDDPLGDEITWEQLLLTAKGKAVWIITEDADYRTLFDGKAYLNAALYEELHALNGGKPEVHCFNSLAEGLAHFVATTKVEAKSLPSPQELETIKEEERALPPIVPLGGRAAMQGYMFQMKQILDLIRSGNAWIPVTGPNAGMYETPAGAISADELRKAMEASKADDK